MSTLNRRRALKTLFCSSAALALNLRSSPAIAVEVKPDALHLLALGDYGTGGKDQLAIAQSMRQFVTSSQIKPQGLWMLGDNFYGGVKEGFAVSSTRWKTGIEDMYPADVFPGPQWAVLGNHDYHDNDGGQEVQLAYARQPGVRWTMPAEWYRVDLGLTTPLVTFIALDSNLPKVSSGKNKKTGKPKGHLSAEKEQQQLAWLKAELAKPRAPFTVVVAHHPLYTNGIHEDTEPLIEQWGELLQEHRVHAYLCGHDHDMQHLELENKFTSFILSGGGGAKVRKPPSERKVPYARDVLGFTHLQVTADTLTFSHHGQDGGLLHRFSKKQDGTVVL